jgi:predicted transcriptional regulator
LHLQLSRRESQIMDALFRLGEGSVGEVRRALDDPPAYNSVRTILGILEEKGLVVHRQEGSKYVYRSRVPAARAARGVVRHVVETFFRGSAPLAVAALLDDASARLTDEEYAELSALLERARRRGETP